MKNLYIKRFLLLLFLMIAGFFLNFLTFYMVHSISFIFGSICTMMAIMLLPVSFSLFAIFIIPVSTYLLWGIHYPYIVFVCEALFVLFFLKDDRKKNIIVYDVLYWFFMGIPLLIYLYHFVKGDSWSITLVIALKQTINAILNVLFAHIIVSYIPILKLFRLSHDRPTYSYRSILFHFGTISLAIPMIFILLVAHKREIRYMENNVYKNLHYQADVVQKSLIYYFDRQLFYNAENNEELKKYVDGFDFESIDQKIIFEKDKKIYILSPYKNESDLKNIKIGIITLQEFHEALKFYMLEQDSDIIVKNEDNKVVISLNNRYDYGSIYNLKEKGTIESIDGQIYKWIPTIKASSVTIAAKSLYFIEKKFPISFLTFVFEYNFSNLQNYFFDSYVLILAILLFFFLLFLWISHRVGHLFSRVPRELVDISKNLPQKIERGEESKWPSTSIYEMDQLIGHFKDMSEALKVHVGFIRQQNTHLESKIEERTQQITASREDLHQTIIELARTNQRLLEEKEVAQHLAEETARSGEVKSQFLSKVAHELRTPLTGIMGILELLFDTKLEEQQKHYVSMAVKCGESLVSLVNDLLDFSRLQSGKLKITPIFFRPKEVVLEIEQIFRQKEENKDIGFRVEIDPKVGSETLLGDPLRVRQILINFISNAFKFTLPGGEVVLKIELLSQTDEHFTFKFSVSDNGKGIVKEEQEMLSYIFSQKGHLSLQEFEGKGLGLLICKKLVDLMEGEISFSSRPDEGSTFWAILTFFKQEHPFEKERSSLTPPPEVNHIKLKILLADDNAVNREILITFLKKIGVRNIDDVTNGQEAFLLSSKNSYDMVFMDLFMPLMDGLETTQKIREMEKEQKREREVPIIAITANAKEDALQKCLDAKMNDFLERPLTLDSVQSMVDKWCADTKKEMTSHELYLNMDIFDGEAISKRLMNDRDLIIRVLNIFISDAETDLKDLDGQINGPHPHFAIIERVAHTLKGASGNVCALRIHQISKEMEQLAKASNILKLKDKLSILEEEFVKFKNEIKGLK